MLVEKERPYSLEPIGTINLLEVSTPEFVMGGSALLCDIRQVDIGLGPRGSLIPSTRVVILPEDVTEGHG